MCHSTQIKNGYLHHVGLVRWYCCIFSQESTSVFIWWRHRPTEKEKVRKFATFCCFLPSCRPQPSGEFHIWLFSVFSLLLFLKLYWYHKEKWDFGHILILLLFFSSQMSSPPSQRSSFCRVWERSWFVLQSRRKEKTQVSGLLNQLTLF